MTAKDLYNLVSGNGGDDLSDAIAILRRECKFCLIGGLAVNCYVEAVFTLDADFVVAIEDTAKLVDEFKKSGFNVMGKKHSLNITRPGSQVRIQITKDDRYLDFPSRAEEGEVLGEILPVACLKDLIQGKIWAYEDPDRRASKREKDRLDLIRIGLKYQEQISIFPDEIRNYVVSQSGKDEEKDEGVKL